MRATFFKYTDYSVKSIEKDFRYHIALCFLPGCAGQVIKESICFPLPKYIYVKSL